MQVYVVNSTPVVCCCTMAGGGYRICRQSNRAKDEMKRTMDNIDEESIKDLRLAGSFLVLATQQPSRYNDVTFHTLVTLCYFGWLFDIGLAYIFCICSIPHLWDTMIRMDPQVPLCFILFRWVDTTGIGWDWVKHHSLEAELGLGIEGCWSRSLLPPKWLSVSMCVQILLQSPLGWFKWTFESFDGKN